MSPDQQRAAADYLGERYGISQRRICRVLGRSRSVLRYLCRNRADEPALNREIKRLARRFFESFDTTACGVNDIAFAPQTNAKGGSQDFFVFD